MPQEMLNYAPPPRINHRSLVRVAVLHSMGFLIAGLALESVAVFGMHQENHYLGKQISPFIGALMLFVVSAVSALLIVVSLVIGPVRRSHTNSGYILFTPVIVGAITAVLTLGPTIIDRAMSTGSTLGGEPASSGWGGLVGSSGNHDSGTCLGLLALVQKCEN